MCIAVCAYSRLAPLMKSRHLSVTGYKSVASGLLYVSSLGLRLVYVEACGGRDSNPELRDMNPPCCLCTTPHVMLAALAWSEANRDAGELNPFNRIIRSAVCVCFALLYIVIFLTES